MIEEEPEPEPEKKEPVLSLVEEEPEGLEDEEPEEIEDEQEEDEAVEAEEDDDQESNELEDFATPGLTLIPDEVPVEEVEEEPEIELEPEYEGVVAKKSSGNQGELLLGGGPKGRFDGESPNVVKDGEDLDIPPYLRKRKRRR